LILRIKLEGLIVFIYSIPAPLDFTANFEYTWKRELLKDIAIMQDGVIYNSWRACYRAAFEYLSFDKNFCSDTNNHTCTYNERFHTTPNYAGFQERFTSGVLAGQNFLYKINNFHVSGRVDTVDIVCHSMGWAYSLGIIEKLRTSQSFLDHKFVFGKLIILAPENPNGYGFSVSYLKENLYASSEADKHRGMFKEVIHFGSRHKDDPNIYHPCQMDGIAHQTIIDGIGTMTYLQNKVGPNSYGYGAAHFHGYYKAFFDQFYINKR
jgi:hypothetical protein